MEQNTLKLDYVHKLREQMQDQEIMFSYLGEITHEVMLALLSMTEKKMIMDGSDIALRNKVFNVMVECMQSITVQGEHIAGLHSALFMIGRSKEGYNIYSGQPIKAEKAHELKNNLLKINNMSREELKEFFIVWINSNTINGKSDPSLSLIDIAKKTGNKLDFDFEAINDSHYYFSLRTAINHH